MSQANVNGEKQNIIITNSFKNSDFEKLEKQLPYSVLEYLFINNYKYSEIKEYLDYNDNIIVNLHNDNNVSKDGKLKVLSKFRINGDSLENLISNNEKDAVLKLDLENVPLDSKTTKRGKYPFYAIVTVTKSYQSILVNNIEFLEAINIDLQEYKALRKNYTSQEWLNLILNTIGYNADTLTPFEKHSLLVRLIPFCIEQYHIIELGNKETAKSYVYSVMSDLVSSSSISAGSISMAKLVRNNSTNEPGILTKKNVINFDEIAETCWKDNDIVRTLQTYLQDGLANRDDGVIVGKASLVFTGNINNLEDSTLNKESLFNHLKTEISNETIIDKLYFFLPGWKFTKVNPNKYSETNATRIRRDYFLCALNLLREETKEYSEIFKDTIKFVKTESGRDMRISSTIAGLIMLLHPDIESMSTEELEALAYITLSGRKMLLRELEIKNNGQYKNELEVENSQVNKKIEFEALSNFIINTSESLLKSHNILIDDIEYYYLDYYKDYDITKEINKQYGFELIEPTIVIKCSNNPNVYKLAVSNYGINMNIIEVKESISKDNVTCTNLTENFMLIETNEIKRDAKKLYIKKSNKSSLGILKELQEKHKQQEPILDIINILMIEQERSLNLSNTIKNLENRIDIQNIETIKNQYKINQMNSIFTIQDIIKSSFSLQDNIQNELNYLRSLFFNALEDTAHLEGIVLQGQMQQSFLGTHTFNDSFGQYRVTYSKQHDNPNNLWIIGRYYSNRNFLAGQPILIERTTKTVLKATRNDKTLIKYIDSIDKILNYLQSNNIIKLTTLIYPKNNIKNISSSSQELDSNIIHIENILNNINKIKDLFLELDINNNFLIPTTLNYYELLKNLSQSIKSYIDTYLIKNKQLSIPSDTSLDLKNTIFDYQYISEIKNSLNSTKNNKN